jgi:hypothetical protein
MYFGMAAQVAYYREASTASFNYTFVRFLKNTYKYTVYYCYNLAYLASVTMHMSS